MAVCSKPQDAADCGGHAFGGNFNWNPAYKTRLSEDRYAYQGAKRVLDAYALWVFNPALQVQLSGTPGRSRA